MQKSPSVTGIPSLLLAALAAALMLAGCADDQDSGPTTSGTESPLPGSGPTDCPAYDRDDYPAWIDADGDCQDTRAEVLISESLVPVTFSDAGSCIVSGGQWLDTYTNTLIAVAGDLDIDHLVPLQEAHDSGAYAWSDALKAAFANDLDAPESLIAVSASANRSKGARDPAEWLPPYAAYQASYASAWVSVKLTWQLTADPAELAALRAILGESAELPQEGREAMCTATAPEPAPARAP